MLKHDLSDLSVNVGGNVIKPSEKVRDLGVILDQTLSYDDHISTICQSAHFHIRNIGRIRNLLWPGRYLQFYLYLLRSHNNVF